MRTAPVSLVTSRIVPCSMFTAYSAGGEAALFVPETHTSRPSRDQAMPVAPRAQPRAIVTGAPPSMMARSHCPCDGSRMARRLPSGAMRTSRT
jgi:hypothetical protein